MNYSSKKLLSNNRGYSLVGVLIMIPIMSIMMLAFSKMLLSSNRFERGIASNSQKTELANGLKLIFQNAKSCATSGLIGIDITPPSGQDANDHKVHLAEIRFPNGGIFAKKGAVAPGTTRLITGVDITDMSLVGNGLNGSDVYLSTLQIDTLTTGQSVGARHDPLISRLNIEIDKATRKIISCSAESLTVSDQQTPGGSTTITGKYDGTCSFYSDAASYSPSHVYVDCPLTQRIALPGRPISVQVKTVGVGQKQFPIVQYSSSKTDTMPGWLASTTYYGAEFLQTNVLEQYHSLIQFGGDQQSGYYFEVRRGLNINWDKAYSSSYKPTDDYYNKYLNPLFDGEYHYTAIVQ